MPRESVEVTGYLALAAGGQILEPPLELRCGGGSPGEGRHDSGVATAIVGSAVDSREDDLQQRLEL